MVRELLLSAHLFEKIQTDCSELESRFAQFRKRGSKHSAQFISETAELYQVVCQHFALLEEKFRAHPLTQSARVLVYEGRRILYGNAAKSSQKASWAQAIARSFATIRGYVAIAALVAFTSGFLSAAVISIHPDFGWAILDEDTVDQVLQGKLWTENIRGKSASAASDIMRNNIGVTLAAFTLGVLGGVGTFVILIINGCHLGAVFAVLAQHNMARPLLEFTLAHGFLEISVILVSAGAGLAIGDGIYNPGKLTRRAAMGERARKALDVILFSAGALVIAGLIEGYVSPYDSVSVPAKFGLGLFVGVVYWTVLIGRRKKILLDH